MIKLLKNQVNLIDELKKQSNYLNGTDEIFFVDEKEFL
jgi:hypothetical protein